MISLLGSLLGLGASLVGLVWLAALSGSMQPLGWSDQ